MAYRAGDRRSRRTVEKRRCDEAARRNRHRRVHTAGSCLRPGSGIPPVDGYTPARTSWGEPDLQGIWSNTTSTPRDARRAELKAALAYGADGPIGLTVVDISTPSEPRVVGGYQTRHSGPDVAVADTAVLVLDGPIRRGSHSQEDGNVIILRQVEN